MGIETLLALLTTISMLSAITMAAFAWKLNSDWCQIGKKMLEIQQDEHMMIMTMMGELYEMEIEDEDLK